MGEKRKRREWKGPHVCILKFYSKIAYEMIVHWQERPSIYPINAIVDVAGLWEEEGATAGRGYYAQ